MINILLLSESNKLKGYGQLMRSIALAIALNKNRETKIVFIFENDKKTINIVNSYSFEYKLIPQEFKRNYSSFLIDFINKLKIKILIIDIKDNYLFEALSTIKSQGVLVVCIDDGFDKRLNADLIFYPPVPQVKKLNWNNFNGKYYVGWEWILIREGFNKKTNKPILNRKVNTNILITTGLNINDYPNKIVRCIESINTNLVLNVDVVINSEYINRENLINLFSNSRHNYTLFEDIKDIEFLMKKADFAIASFGQVAYELAACNTPCILLSLTKDHYYSSSAFDFYGIGVSAELGLKNWSKLSEIIYKFISGGYFFKNMKENLNKIPIESGCKKISDLIIEEYKKNS